MTGVLPALAGSFASLRMTESGSDWRPLPLFLCSHDSKWELSPRAEGFFFGLGSFLFRSGSGG